MILRRRANLPKLAEYGRYEPLLREDFRYCCGDCRSHESTYGSRRDMPIDHFRPRSHYPRLVAEYGNLHYCCNECNTYKGDRWPTEAEVADGYRFVDACVDDPDDHYEYVGLEIRPKTRPGEFTVAILRLGRLALLTRRREIQVRFAECVESLERTARMGATARANDEADATFEEDLRAVQAHLVDQLRELIFPARLAS